MSFVTRQAAHCDVCGHEWLTAGQPTHCAKCKSRKWNQADLRWNPGKIEPIDDGADPEGDRIVQTAEFHSAFIKQTHNPKTCRIYKCGMCAAVKDKAKD